MDYSLSYSLITTTSFSFLTYIINQGVQLHKDKLSIQGTISILFIGNQNILTQCSAITCHKGWTILRRSLSPPTTGTPPRSSIATATATTSMPIATAAFRCSTPTIVIITRRVRSIGCREMSLATSITATRYIASAYACTSATSG
ncbi:hypothetical protein ACHAWU_007333 [Discostella pseudostelligera]|uniref:Uncharacterized protein n=1 Tax=Discostella pseudostelligera TaxID=259834 RepID=A0ABD3LYV8_9STRA